MESGTQREADPTDYPYYCGNAARDAVGGGLDGIVGEVGIAGCGLHLGMSEQLADHPWVSTSTEQDRSNAYSKKR